MRRPDPYDVFARILEGAEERLSNGTPSPVVGTNVRVKELSGGQGHKRRQGVSPGGDGRPREGCRQAG